MATGRAIWDDLDGWAAAHGLPDLEDIPLRRFCNLVWWFITQGRNEQDIARVRARLWQPPKEAPQESLKDARSPWNPENEKAALGAFMAQVSGTVQPKSQ